MASRRIFIAGGHTTPFLGSRNPNFINKKHPDFGKKNNPSLRDMLTTAVTGALNSTKVSSSIIDRTYVGNFAGELFSQQGHLGAALAGISKDFMYKPSMRIEGACASGGLAIAAACDALNSGNADVILVVGAEQQTTASAADGAQYLARAADFHRQATIDSKGLTFPCLLARRAKAYAEKYPSFKLDDLCPIVAKAYANGNKNPNAHMHAVKISLEGAKVGEKNPNFLGNEDYVDFLRLTDCSQVSDGASAIVLTNEAGLAKTGLSESSTIELLTCQYGCGNLYEDAQDLAAMDTTHAVVNRVYEKTGLSVKDVNVAEVHDCFSIAELLMYEAMGLAVPGQGANVAKEGLTEINGVLPINTGGGLMSYGHPVGATGVKQVHEIYKQMKGECGDYQMSKKPEIGMTINMGGDDKTIVSMMMKNL